MDFECSAVRLGKLPLTVMGTRWKRVGVVMAWRSTRQLSAATKELHARTLATTRNAYVSHRVATRHTVVAIGTDASVNVRIGR